MLSISPAYLLLYLPLLVAIAVVYGGTRHESTGAIIREALHTARWITTFLVAVFAVLAVMSYFAS